MLDSGCHCGNERRCGFQRTRRNLLVKTNWCLGGAQRSAFGEEFDTLVNGVSKKMAACD